MAWVCRAESHLFRQAVWEGENANFVLYVDLAVAGPGQGSSRVKTGQYQGQDRAVAGSGQGTGKVSPHSGRRVILCSTYHAGRGQGWCDKIRKSGQTLPLKLAAAPTSKSKLRAVLIS